MGKICAAVMYYEIHLASFFHLQMLCSWLLNQQKNWIEKKVEQMLLRCPGSVIKLYYLVELYNWVGYDEVRRESAIDVEWHSCWDVFDVSISII